jgi:hypothetical protein
MTSCPLYNEIRKEHFVKIKGTVITAIGVDSWKRNLCMFLLAFLPL